MEAQELKAGIEQSLSKSDIESEMFEQAKSWPFAEARALRDRLGKIRADIDANHPVIFETGYGPSGLPHIGTFGEVVRTSMVRHAFEKLTGQQTRLICFSDDMDGLRKVPDNVPNQEMMAQHLGKPLTEVPDPFATHDSFGAHNNARLMAFLDGFGFEYEFFSATQCYRTGVFDAALMQVLKHYDAIMEVVLPTLGEERRATYSPFLPICPDTREVLQVEMIERDYDKGVVLYKDPRSGKVKETAVTGGHCKLQWKCDWAMRWCALGVDYEMSGKDLIESVTLSSKIARIMGGTPPAGISYELFLDQDGQKISKSKGNGLSVDEWLKYATQESLSLFMYNQPGRAKRLFFDSIPKAVDDYFAHLDKYHAVAPTPAAPDTTTNKMDNPVWHIHCAAPPQASIPVNFSLLLNLAGVCQAETPEVLWGYLNQYAEGVSAKTHPQLARLVEYAVVYYQDRIKPYKHRRAPNAGEKQALENLCLGLRALALDAPIEEIQSVVFAAGTDANYENLRDWFRCLYQVLLGQDEGPRMGSFIKLYGINETCDLIELAISGTLADGDGK